MITARLAHPGDREGFYRHLDSLLADDVAWDAVDWVCGSEIPARVKKPSAACTRTLPRGFIEVCDLVLLHQNADRFMRLHAFARRLRDDARHWDDVLHPEHRYLQLCAAQVRRDMHKMKAFVRFTPVPRNCHSDQLAYAAWFEPEHHILHAMSGFFMRRFANMHWTILAPQGTLVWDRRELTHGPPATRPAGLDVDPGADLWLTYYRSIFNPARLKERAMRREMPVKFWKNLPEAALIPGLIAEAPLRARAMLAHHEPGRRCGSPTRSTEPRDALLQLQREIQRCGSCDCAMRATQAVAGEGAAGARVMLVGEQPGDREDLEGRPFVGPAGELLRAALADAGIRADEVFITNAVKHFSYQMRGKRRIHKTPRQQDILACAHWLQRESELVRPEQVLLLGRTAMQAATECWGLPPDAGPWVTTQGAGIQVVAHPASLLRAGERPGSAGYLRWVAQIARASGERRDEEPGQQCPGSRG